MRRFTLGIGILVALGMAPAMFADITDYMLNINGSTFCPFYGASSGCTTILGNGSLMSTIPNVVSSIDETIDGTGLGSVTVTFNPGIAGNFNVNLWVFEQLSEQSSATSGPGFNEYGKVNGSAAGGETYQIDVPDYDSSGDQNTSAQGTIAANTAASTLDNQNDVPGGSGACPGPNCNDFTSMALGFNFTLDGTDQEIVTFTVGTSNPGGFSLQQIHPADDPHGSGSSPEIDYYFSGTATSQPSGTTPPPTVPEPGSVLLLATIAGGLFRTFRSRSAAVNEK